MAGLLLGAILSDTMNFTSPTTTEMDIKIAKELEIIAKTNSNDLYVAIVKHGNSLLNRRSIDILYEDKSEFDAVKKSIKMALEDNCKTKGLDLMICLMTDIYGAGSYVLAAGNKNDIIHLIFNDYKEDKMIGKLVSRKKQLLPKIIEVLS